MNNDNAAMSEQIIEIMRGNSGQTFHQRADAIIAIVRERLLSDAAVEAGVCEIEPNWAMQFAMTEPLGKLAAIRTTYCSALTAALDVALPTDGSQP